MPVLTQQKAEEARHKACYDAEAYRRIRQHVEAAIAGFPHLDTLEQEFLDTAAHEFWTLGCVVLTRAERGAFPLFLDPARTTVRALPTEDPEGPPSYEAWVNVLGCNVKINQELMIITRPKRFAVAFALCGGSDVNPVEIAWFIRELGPAVKWLADFREAGGGLP